MTDYYDILWIFSRCIKKLERHVFVSFLFPLFLRSSDLDYFPDDDDDVDDEEDEERSTVNSPEPPEPVEPDDAMLTDENRKLGTLHPEQDLPYLFKVGEVFTTFVSQQLLFGCFSLNTLVLY